MSTGSTFSVQNAGSISGGMSYFTNGSPLFVPQQQQMPQRLPRSAPASPSNPFMLPSPITPSHSFGHLRIGGEDSPPIIDSPVPHEGKIQEVPSGRSGVRTFTTSVRGRSPGRGGLPFPATDSPPQNRSPAGSFSQPRVIVSAQHPPTPPSLALPVSAVAGTVFQAMSQQQLSAPSAFLGGGGSQFAPTNFSQQQPVRRESRVSLFAVTSQTNASV